MAGHLMSASHKDMHIRNRTWHDVISSNRESVVGVGRVSSIVSWTKLMMTLMASVCFLTADGQSTHDSAAAAVFESTTTLPYETFCETEAFNASCDSPSDVILMTHARYGRMRLSRCAKIDYGHIGCASDVLELTDSRCSGRKSCEITIPDALFVKSQPCPEDLKPYLEVGYQCVAVENPAVSCPFPGNLVISAPVHRALPVVAATAQSEAAKPPPASLPPSRHRTSGYLANWVTEVTGCGGLSSPWMIETDPGRRVRLTLLDFHVARVSRPDGYVRPRCPLYAVVREHLPAPVGSPPAINGAILSGSSHHHDASVASGVRKVTICGGGNEREKVVYTSTTNRIEIGLARNDDVTVLGGVKGPYFLLKYEGCADIAPIHGAVTVRTGDHLIVKCNHSRDEYHLKCVSMQWIGSINNCTIVSSLSTAAEKVLDENNTVEPMSYGSSIVIVLITALSIGLLVLAGGLLILTRRRSSSLIRRRKKTRSARRTPSRDYDKDYTTSGHLLYETAKHQAADNSATANFLYVDSLAAAPLCNCNSATSAPISGGEYFGVPSQCHHHHHRHHQIHHLHHVPVDPRDHLQLQSSSAPFCVIDDSGFVVQDTDCDAAVAVYGQRPATAPIYHSRALFDADLSMTDRSRGNLQVEEPSSGTILVVSGCGTARPDITADASSSRPPVERVPLSSFLSKAAVEARSSSTAGAKPGTATMPAPQTDDVKYLQKSRKRGANACNGTGRRAPASGTIQNPTSTLLLHSLEGATGTSSASCKTASSEGDQQLASNNTFGAEERQRLVRIVPSARGELDSCQQRKDHHVLEQV